MRRNTGSRPETSDPRLRPGSGALALTLVSLALAAAAAAAQERQSVFTWHDGDSVREVVLVQDLADVIERRATADRRRTGDSPSAASSPSATGAAEGDQPAPARAPTAFERALLEAEEKGRPVFRTRSGELLLLPGGVIVQLRPGLDPAAALAPHGVNIDRVRPIEHLADRYLIRTEPGLESLELANALFGQEGILSSRPNWAREIASK